MTACCEFNRDGGTVEMIGAEHSPGHELMSGSLGPGLSQAAGIAYARKRKGETGRVWVFMSDGEFQSGQTWETLQATAFHKIDNLGVYVDVNGYQCDGRMLDVMNVEPLDQRLKAFGARVCRVDGHDLDALAAPAARKPAGRPLVVLAMTDTCRGMEILRGQRPQVPLLPAEERRRVSPVSRTAGEHEVNHGNPQPGSCDESCPLGEGQARGVGALGRPDQFMRDRSVSRRLPGPLPFDGRGGAEHAQFCGRPGPGGIRSLHPYVRRVYLSPGLRPDRHVRGVPEPAGANVRLLAGGHESRRSQPPGDRGHRLDAQRCRI